MKKRSNMRQRVIRRVLLNAVVIIICTAAAIVLACLFRKTVGASEKRISERSISIALCSLIGTAVFESSDNQNTSMGVNTDCIRRVCLSLREFEDRYKGRLANRAALICLSEPASWIKRHRDIVLFNSKEHDGTVIGRIVYYTFSSSGVVSWQHDSMITLSSRMPSGLLSDAEVEPDDRFQECIDAGMSTALIQRVVFCISGNPDTSQVLVPCESPDLSGSKQRGRE